MENLSCVAPATVRAACPAGSEIFTKKAEEIGGLQAAVEESYREAETVRAALTQVTLEVEALRAELARGAADAGAADAGP
jgi:hypothetical protein